MITVISHDAGGAEVLSSYIRQQNMRCVCVLEGPACKIFARKLNVVNQKPLLDAIKQADFILCGTSWQSDLEFNAIKIAHSLSKRSVAFLDHWTNYKERFIRGGELCLPDEIWVGDTVAEVMAKKIFPNLPIQIVKNPYFNEICQELEKVSIRGLSPSDKLSVLYVCEPIREHALKQHGNALHWGYTEEGALRYFLSNLEILGKKIERIVIRPHPSESAEKYHWVQKEFNLPIKTANLALLEDIIESDIVVGCESMAMVIGMLAGKKVISSIPPGGAPCILPQNEIIHLQSLINNTKTL